MHTCMLPDPDFFLHFRNNINSLFTSTPNPSRSDPRLFCIFQNNFCQFFGHIHLPPIFCHIHPLDPRLFCIFTKSFFLVHIHSPGPLLYWNHIHPTPDPDFLGIATITSIYTTPTCTPYLFCIFTITPTLCSHQPLPQF